MLNNRHKGLTKGERAMQDYFTVNQTGYPSVDKPWLKYYTDEDLQITIPKCSVFQNIYNRNSKYPNDIALLYYGNKISYKSMLSEVERCAKTLRKVGIKKGDCVTLCTAAVPEAVFVVLACSRIGAIANFINPMFSTSQKIDRINDTDASWIIVLDEIHEYVEEALPKTCIKNVVIVPATNSVQSVVSKALYLKSKAKKIISTHMNDLQKYILWNDFVKLGAGYEEIIDELYESDTPTVMVYSSGTTGASKGILLTNDGINATISNYMIRSFPYKRGDIELAIIPIWFSTGMVLGVLMPLTLGITVALEPKFNNEQFASDLMKYKPNITVAATNMWLSAVESLENKKVDLTGLNYPVSGGEKLSETDECRIQDFLKQKGCNAPIIKGYGMCELGSTISTTARTHGYTSKTFGNGYPILNAIVSAFNVDTDEELPYGERGEIRACSPARMKGYYKNPNATNEFFKTDEQGKVWGCTGDIGYVDKDGEIFILGRVSDSYRRENGEIVYLFEIENDILKDDCVNQCKVVDVIEDEKTALVAHLVLRDKEVDINETIKRIDRRIRKSLPEYKIPHYYKIRESMPVNSNGKKDVIALKKDKDDLIKI